MRVLIGNYLFNTVCSRLLSLVEMRFESVAYIFKAFRKNAEMQTYVKAHPEVFMPLVEMSLDKKDKKAWRCAMLVGHLITKNDTRIKGFIDFYIDNLLAYQHDGHQRQILIILDKMNLTEIQEGKLFDKCMTLWEDINKIPSTRIRAFWMLLKIGKSYPEILKEITHFTTAYYLETLSPGIRVIIEREIKKMHTIP